MIIRLILLALVLFLAYQLWTRYQRGLTRAKPPAPSPKFSDQTQDLVKCAVCGTYVPSHHARSCGRADCPHAG